MAPATRPPARLGPHARAGARPTVRSTRPTRPAHRGHPGRQGRRVGRAFVLGAAIIVAGLAYAAFMSDAATPSPPTIPLPDTTSSSATTTPSADQPGTSAEQPDRPLRTTTLPASALDDGIVGPEDGLIPGHATPFDVHLPAIANLDADLLRAVQQAAKDAGADGIAFLVTSGWRSPAYQRQLLEEAIEDYGSVEEASRYVATPETSAHVTGNAIDIGPTDADSWLSQHGARYGLCQTYANEMWHFELATAPGGTCPQMRRDASS